MRPTTLFNHDEILRSTNAPIDETVVAEQPAGEQSGQSMIGSSSFSIFNEMPDAVRSRGFHMSAKLLIALAVAGTFGGYAIARESKGTQPTVVQQEPAQAEQTPSAAPLPAIDPIASPTAVDATNGAANTGSNGAAA